MYKRFQARDIAYSVNREFDSGLLVGASIDLSKESVSGRCLKTSSPLLTLAGWA